ncbi:MAG: adenosylcobinamide kinase [Sulfurimonas sp.]|nr:MAG: adenosylcobinamide kinase [Sulfurimonas sp.]
MKNTKTLFIGGIKSGKSANAEKYILNISENKPIYIITTEFVDAEMKPRIDAHKERRADNFITVEEPLKLYDIILDSTAPLLIECVSMWINNMLYNYFTLQDMQDELEKILSLDRTIVFVLNDVGTGVIPDNKLARIFVDISGKLSQQIASSSDEVYQTIAGISTKIK